MSAAWVRANGELRVLDKDISDTQDWEQKFERVENIKWEEEFMKNTRGLDFNEKFKNVFPNESMADWTNEYLNSPGLPGLGRSETAPLEPSSYVFEVDNPFLRLGLINLNPPQPNPKEPIQQLSLVLGQE